MTSGRRTKAKRRAASERVIARSSPESSEPSPSFALKLDRAGAHIEELEKAIRIWEGRGAYSVVEEVGDYIDSSGIHIINVKRHALVLRLQVPIPPEWSMVIGDTVHDLRTALDHVTFALNSKGYAEAHQGAALSATASRASEFPIIGGVDAKGSPGGGPQRFTRAAKSKIAHVPDGARSVIEDVQPYKRGPNDWATDPLWLIHDLDRIDKHRQLLVATASGRSVRVGQASFPGSMLDVGIGRIGPLEDGDELVHWVPISEDEPPPKLDLNFGFVIAFGEGSAATGLPIQETLPQLRKQASHVIAQLESFL